MPLFRVRDEKINGKSEHLIYFDRYIQEAEEWVTFDYVSLSCAQVEALQKYYYDKFEEMKNRDDSEDEEKEENHA
jgi:hypothetical protein